MPVFLHLWCCTHHQNRMKSQSSQILGEERVFLWLSRLVSGSLCTTEALQNCPCAWNSLEKVKVAWSEKGCFNFPRQRNFGLRQNNLVWDISWVVYPHQPPRGWLWEQIWSQFKWHIEYSDICNEKAVSSTDFFQCWRAQCTEIKLKMSLPLRAQLRSLVGKRAINILYCFYFTALHWFSQPTSGRGLERRHVPAEKAFLSLRFGTFT